MAGSAGKPEKGKELGALMSESVANPEANETPEMLLDDRQHFWQGFYHFVWTVAGCIVVLLVLMAYFLL